MSVARTRYYASSFDEPENGQAGAQNPPPDNASRLEDLPFRVELWDERKTKVERVLAFTASGSIGYAAYHAATAEFPDRYIVLRHNGGLLSRWNGPTH